MASCCQETPAKIAATSSPAGGLASLWGPAGVATLDHTTLCPGAEGVRFNSSIIEHGKGYALAFRTGWKGSQIYVATLNSKLESTGFARRLPLRHRFASFGREDPRLFRLNGRLHCVFVGVMGGRRPRHTNVLFARLSEEFAVEDIFFPRIPGRQLWEKNHSYFDVAGVAHAVYSIKPHRVMRVEGDRAEFVAREDVEIPWTGGELRGGASPVRVGNEWWSFFHGRAEYRGATAYNLGLYTFDVNPPFRPLRVISDPLVWADHSTKPEGQYVSCVFPCGAVRRGDEWIVSSGEHDRWTRFDRFSHADLNASLRAIA